MKKIGLGLLLAAFTMMFTGCYFIVNLTADVTIENKTDKTFVYMASYNYSLKASSATASVLAPGDKVNLKLEGIYTEFNIEQSSDEVFAFYYMEKSVFDAYKEEHPNTGDWYTLTNSGVNSKAEAENKNSQVYKVIINPSSDGSDNIVTELSWE